MTSEKRCSRCGEVKPLTEFHRSSSKADGRHTYCKPCNTLHSAAGYRKRLYGLSPEEWVAMQEAQNYLCAICGGPPPKGRTLDIDHDHRCCPEPPICGKCIRGLLCLNCNRGIGHFFDDPERCVSAGVYLERTA